MTVLDSPLHARLFAMGGAVGLADLEAIGVDATQADRWVREGVLRRVRRGAYVHNDAWQAGDRATRRMLEARAVLRGFRGSDLDAGQIARVGSGHTALAVHRLPVLHDDPLVVLARVAAGGAYRHPGVVVERCWGPGSAVQLAGVGVVRPEVAVISHALRSGLEAGVVACDAALHHSLVTTESLMAWIDANARRPGIRSARQMLHLADGLAESPGESLTRLILVGAGFPVRSQVEIGTDAGCFRVDLLVRNVVIEFDGAVKYDGADGRAALVAEKRREDALRRAGYEVVRLVWSDLTDPARVVQLARTRMR
ncbi:type IV toxin-antitoxin system AbiEi family antitoxin domain-containing protein [Calidifontibacter sp. DB0510]|uniref:Type IV toxin-antitoxin system AbiEi family antitoxin domain-containing protein n=1 Tax=Metallococcus carri TaxID=1656884 RepID=A0A967E8P0_9MICO|nr:type IV toxin-antitoxin system AbiEi family antitoxin domain-containing protein [Metallococcus carri]NHN54390.1 type IV toxin-antitoxin system AbiEi family antitoxin domain-containing protein [Metallococcus carri]NOP36771.1 type IV toxin-antitoxin system AbiEi family antitoxin domain-containing protein [Calidifontibacter sp. DB2511S]